MQTGFLGLGRAVRVQRRWLNDTDAWDLTAAIQTQLYIKGSRFPEFKDELMLRSVWPLGSTPAADEATAEAQVRNGSEWLLKIAIVLCHEPVSAYMDNQLCKGIKPRKRHAVAVTPTVGNAMWRWTTRPSQTSRPALSGRWLPHGMRRTPPAVAASTPTTSTVTGRPPSQWSPRGWQAPPHGRSTLRPQTNWRWRAASASVPCSWTSQRRWDSCGDARTWRAVKM